MVREGVCGMTKLKILKDLPETEDVCKCGKKSEFTKGYLMDDCGVLIHRKELRLEAVKWVKHHNKNIHSAKTKGLKVFELELDGAVKWIVHFFGLTEEELKEEK